MRHSRWLALSGLLCILTLAGCPLAPAVPGTQEASPAAALDTTELPPSPTGPLPEIVFSDLAVVHGDDAGEWNVLGMARNDSHSALEAVVIRVELLDTAGTATGEATVWLPLSVLQPEATSPFMARVEQVEPPSGARASLVSLRTSTEAPARTSTGAVRATQAPDGVFVLGSVQSRDSRPVRIHDVVVTWRDAHRSLAGLAVASVPGAILEEGRSAPWMAEAPGTTSETNFEVFAAASTVDPASASSLVTASPPAWLVTSQGHGFATGAIRNAGGAPVLPEVAIAASAAGQLISLEILQSSIPMQPGETLIYAADRFPGLEAALDSAGIDVTDISLELYLDAKPIPPNADAAVPLPVSIGQFEVIGSSVFLRGTISSPGSVPLKSAMVFVSLRATTGEPQSARWLELAPPATGESAQFSLDMPLAAGIDPAMSEYDVRAWGLPLTASSW